MNVVAPFQDTSAPTSEHASARDGARPLLVLAGLGIVLAALTWHLADAGPGWLFADVICVLALLAAGGPRRPGLAAWLLAGASVWTAAVPCWRASDWALGISLPVSLGALLALGLVRARAVRASELGEVPRAAVAALRALPGGLVDAARMPGAALGSTARGHALGVLRGVLLGAPVALLFIALLAADGAFRHALERGLGRAGEGFDYSLWTLAAIAAVAVGYAVLARVARPAAEVPPFDLGPYRVSGDAARPVAPARVGPRVRPITWGVVLSQLVATFGIYVWANRASFFAGHDHLRARGTVTYAAYVHEGFTQVSLAALLAVTTVVIGHALLRPRAAHGAGTIPGGRGLAVIEVTLLVLVGVTLASSAHRLALYEEAYGYTRLRLVVWLMQLGVGGLLAMTAARSLARAWQGWGSALFWAGLAFACAASSIDADRWIAARNVQRAREGAPLDVDYLETLSEDARSTLPAVRALDLDAASTLEQVWLEDARAHRSAGWRSLRGLGSR